MYELPVIPEPAKYNHSFSSLKTFADICEYRYALEKVRKWEGGVDAQRGTQIHEALDAWASAGFAESELQKLLATPGPLSSQELEGWLRRVQPATAGLAVVRNEFWVRAELPGCAHPLVGKVDLHAKDEDGDLLVDWKSVNSMGKKLTQGECDRSLQGRIYAAVTGIRRFRFVYFTSNHDAEIVQSEYSDAQLDEAWKYVAHTCKHIEDSWRDQRWRRAFPGGLCSKTWCSSFETCYGSGDS